MSRFLPFYKSVLRHNLKNKSPVLLLFTRSIKSRQLIYKEFGEPASVVTMVETDLSALKPDEVLVRMIAAPVNPADINTIQGKYPVKLTLPSIPGNEGVGIVEEVGINVRSIQPGNKVIVTKPLQGTWRELGSFDKNVLRVVPQDLGNVEAATLTVNPCTAYRMLSDFIPVRSDKDAVVIQNGGNSACGQNIIQICKAWNIPNISIVRNRAEIDNLKQYLTNLGATHVLTEEEVRGTNLFKDKIINKPSLALNCVGGESSLEMSRHLRPAGKMVTYGGMSRQPVTVSASQFIFQNLSFHGFWMTHWNEKASQKQKDEMLQDIIDLILDHKLRGPKHTMISFERFSEALSNALAPATGCKYILDLQNECFSSALGS